MHDYVPMKRKKSAIPGEVLQYLAAGEVIPAVVALKQIAASTWREKAASGDLDVGPEAFLDLLRHRGYFVATAGEVAQTLEEIVGMGEGFDLHDLARALAEYDTTLTKCLKLTKQPLFPELGRFVVMCPCGAHGNIRG